MEQVSQIFNPPLHLCLNSKEDVVEIKERIWNCEENNSLSDQQVQKMGYIGQNQIEEVWKQYPENKTMYFSNYGYCAEIKETEAKEIFADRLDDFSSHQGVVYKSLDIKQQRAIKDHVVMPYNKDEGYPSAKYSRCEVCLKNHNTSEDLHRIIAKLFLETPENTKNYVVHHIDNNSFNNSVTNLIWLKSEQHNGQCHPMSK